MKLPAKLKLGGHTIAVKVVPKVNEDGRCGEWEPLTNTITIRADQAASQKEVTLLHEILHSFNIILQHEQVEWMAQAVYQAIVDNKLYFDGKE